MPLPRRIQEQADAAEALLQQINAAPSSEPPASPQPSDPAPVVPDPQPEPAPSPAPAPGNDDFNRLLQQHRSLQGVHRSMDERVRQTTAENQSLKERLDALERERNRPAPTPAVDHKDTEVFGDELVQMVVRQATAQLNPLVQAIEQRFRQLEGSVVGTNQALTQTKEEVFMSKLKDAVPDFAQINVDPEFLQWLGEEDGVSGIPRQVVLDKASQQLNVERTAKVFLGFKATKPAAPATPSKSRAEAQLEREITPSGSSAAPAAPRATRSYLLTKEVTDFYDEVRKGLWKGKDTERAAIELTINNAMAANRIFDRPPTN